MGKSFNKKEKLIIKSILLGCIVFLIFVLYWFRNPFVEEYSIEAGKSITIEELLKDKDARNPKFITEINESIINKIGSHTIKVYGNDGEFEVIINVSDTIAPTAKAVEKTMWISDEITSDMFLGDIKDATTVTSSFKETPDFNKKGKQDVTIVLKDEAGNTTEYNTVLNLKKDTIAPTIEIVNTIISNKGENILYKKYATIYDNRENELTLTIDNSKVKLEEPGTYKVLYTVTDKAGNSTKKNVNVLILSPDETQLKTEAQEYAQKLIDKLTDDSMSKDKKLEKCFYYILNNVKYKGGHQGTTENYYVDALSGFKTLTGDCLVSNGMLRVVCELLDVPTMVVVRTSNRPSNHYWFMANTGDGWYHYDAYKRPEGTIYKWTDKKLLAWSKEWGGLADYDTSKFPSSPEV